MGMVGVQGYMVPFDEWPEEVKQYYKIKFKYGLDSLAANQGSRHWLGT